MAVDICKPQSSWTYAHTRGRGHHYSRNAAPAASADLRGPGPQDAKTVVIALHCSGSSGRQWGRLAETLGGQYAVVAPDLFGSGSNGHWSGERSFKLADEAAPVIDIIDACQAPVHLVGHSYGGAVALRVALARPSRVASLSLYEPVAFHLLNSMGPDGLRALRKLRALFTAIERAVVTGSYRSAAERFVSHWSGSDAWAAMKPEVRAEIVRYIPKACLEARAVTQERTPLMAYGRLRMPTLLMQGERGAEATALVARKLAQVMKSASRAILEHADHMGPLTSSEDVNSRVHTHILRSTPSGYDAPAAIVPSRARA